MLIPNQDTESVPRTRPSPARVAPSPASRTMAGRITRTAAWVLMLLLALIVVAIVSRYFQFDPSTYFPEQRAIYIHREVVLGIHISGGILALVLGPFQFLPRLRRRFTRVHRAIGVGYVAGVTAAALAGLILATTAYGGLVSSLGFTFLALAALFTTWTAVRMMLLGRYADHGHWMVRSFSLCFAGVMLRLLLLTYENLSGIGLVNFSFKTAYIGIAWLCWVPNLLIALAVTRRSRQLAVVGSPSA